MLVTHLSIEPDRLRDAARAMIWGARAPRPLCHAPRGTRIGISYGTDSRLRGQAFPCNEVHLLAEAIQFAKRSVHVGRDADALEFFVHYRHSENPVFVEQVFRYSLRIGAVDVNISYCAGLIRIERSVEPNFAHVLELVHPVTGYVA